MKHLKNITDEEIVALYLGLLLRNGDGGYHKSMIDSLVDVFLGLHITNVAVRSEKMMVNHYDFGIRKDVIIEVSGYHRGDNKI